MSDHSSVDEVSSGAPYRVVTVNDQPTADLEALLAKDVAVMVVVFGNQEVTVHGAAHRLDDRTVVVHEKSFDGIGKDVRTWAVTATADGLEAVERSIF